jgi:transposase
MKQVGIDIGKDKFDVCLLDEERQEQTISLPNTKSGINKLHQWLKKQGAQQAHVCLEATGVYGELLAEEMHQRGYGVSVVNPARIKAYAASQMRRNKTDALDAALIADYCRTQEPAAWSPPAPEVKELRTLVRHLNSLKQEKRRAKNRLAVQKDRTVSQHLKQQVNLLDKQIAQTEEAIRQHLDHHPDLKKDRDLLDSIPGIGHLTACVLLAELADVRRFDDVRELVAFVGLNPRQYQSGRKQATHSISRMGNASLRAALYMPAIVAKQHNPRLNVWAETLSRRGLTGKQVIVAVMRKLLHLAYGILKSGQPFDPHYQSAKLLATP